MKLISSLFIAISLVFWLGCRKPGLEISEIASTAEPRAPKVEHFRIDTGKTKMGLSGIEIEFFIKGGEDFVPPPNYSSLEWQIFPVLAGSKIPKIQAEKDKMCTVISDKADFLFDSLALVRKNSADAKNRRITAFVPWSYLRPFSGKTQAIEWQVRGVSVKRDTLDKIIDEKTHSMGRYLAQMSVPVIYSGHVVVEGFVTDTTKYEPSSMDVRYTGPGWPDLGWELYLDNFAYYCSPEMKNEVVYQHTDTSSLFCFTAADEYILRISDRDDLSSNDKMGEFPFSPYAYFNKPKNRIEPFDDIKSVDMRVIPAIEKNKVTPKNPVLVQTSKPKTTAPKVKSSKTVKP